MEKNKNWATKMLDLDLKGQEGSIWTKEKSKNKSKKYKIKEDESVIMNPDPVYYGNRKIEESPKIVK